MTRRFALTLAGLTLAAAVAMTAGCGQSQSKYDAMTPAQQVMAAGRAGPVAEAAAALDLLLDHECPIIRAQAAQTLGMWAAVDDAYLVLKALGHADPLVRGMAQAAYIEHNAYGLAPLVTEGNLIEVPPAVLEALAAMEDPAGMVRVRPIIEGLRDALRTQLDGDAVTAVLAADVLAHIGDVGARRRLITLSSSKDDAILAKVARACVRDDMILGPTLLPSIYETGGTTADRAVMRALVAAPDPRLAGLLLKGMASGDAAVRHNAIRAMGNLGGAAPVPQLAAALKRGGDTSADILRALGAIGLPAADVLREYLNGRPSPDLEVTALLALAPNASRDDIPALTKRLASANRNVRAASASALGKIAHPSAQAALVETLADEDPLVRAAAAKALGQIGTLYAAQTLVPMLKDPSPLVGSMAAWGLGQSKYPDAVQPLIEVARARPSRDATPARVGEMFGWPELAAVEALGRIATPEAVAFLVNAADTQSWLLRATVMQALGTTRNSSPEVTKVLHDALADPVNLVRAQAHLALSARPQPMQVPEAAQAE